MQSIIKLLLSKKYYIVSFIVMLSVVFSSMFMFTAKADEVILDDVNPDFKKAAIGDGDPWQATTTYSQDNGNYAITTDAYTIWWQQDDFDYFYKQYSFNYGRKATMTIETTLTSFDGSSISSTASAGIVLRSSLDAGASTVFLHVRQNGVLMIYRSKDGLQAVCSPSQPINIDGKFPVSLRCVVSNQLVTAYYKVGSTGTWSKMAGSFPLSYTDSVYVGLGSHSSLKGNTTAVFNGFDVSLVAPDGTEYVEPGTGNNGGSGEEPTEPTVVLPPDVDVTDDVLLRETFTDGSMSGDDSVTNPNWVTDNVNPQIITNDSSTNRYLELAYDDKYYYAGSQKWIDYSAEVNLTFSPDSLPSEKNSFKFFVRHRYSEMNGNFYYAVSLNYNDFLDPVDKQIKRKGMLSIVSGQFCQMLGSDYINNSAKITQLASTDLNYLSDSTTHNLKVSAFDNIITVFWDGVQVLKVTDTGNYFKGFGNVGFYSSNANLTVDNICVRKLYDYFGGDYDNRIGGNFDSIIPDYLKEFDQKGWAY